MVAYTCENNEIRVTETRGSNLLEVFKQWPLLFKCPQAWPFTIAFQEPWGGGTQKSRSVLQFSHHRLNLPFYKMTMIKQ